MVNFLANLLGPNWRTLVAGLFTAVMVGIYDASVSGTLHKSTIAVIIGMAVVSYFAKDKQVTGGTTPNVTPNELADMSETSKRMLAADANRLVKNKEGKFVPSNPTGETKETK